jgi:cytochrome c oxidase subunit 3
LAEAHALPAHQFDDLAQQREAATLGMWVFLATEVLFFGGLFLGYIVYRTLYPVEFAAGSHHLIMPLGAINTAVLLTSSWTMALAVRAAQLGQRRALIALLLCTVVLGACFLGIKMYEWWVDYREGLVPGPGFTYVSALSPALTENAPGVDPRRVEIFFLLYFFMTGLHALHMIIGIGLLLIIAFLAHRWKFSAQYYSPVEISGLYWHFVDVIWIFLFPLLYLIGHH